MNTRIDNTEELFYEIGVELSESTFGVEEQSREDLIIKGKRWFESQQTILQEKVCRPDILAMLKREPNNQEKLIDLIVDAISSIVLYVPLMTVARLLVAIGVEQLCSSCDLNL